MAREILSYDGTVTGVSGTYPYGQIKDDPAGTVANVKSNGDLQQYFQRFMARAGITPNNLPDNATNGFQLVAAVINQINVESAALAECVGAGGFVAVRATGLSGGIVGSTLAVSAGWLYYNGKFCYFAGGSCATTGSQLMTITIVEGLPTLTLTSIGGSITPDATHFDYNSIIDHPIITQGFRLTTAEANIAMGAWVNVTLGTGYTNNGGTTAQVRKDGMGRVFIKGYLLGSGSSGVTSICTLPAGYLPTQITVKPCSCTHGGAESTKGMVIDAGTGVVSFYDPSTSPATGWTVILDGLGSWLTT
jgi:hypothetical protein